MIDPNNRPVYRNPLSRRTFLRGAAGAALVTPWLESLPMRAEETGKLLAASVSDKPPVRFACLCFADGVEPDYWWAKGQGTSMELGEALSPMAPHREDMLFINGLYNQQAAEHRSVHLGRFPNLLSGAWVGTEQGNLSVGRTIDQVMAQHVGAQTKVPALTLGIEPTELRLEDGLSMIYGSCISWVSDNKPAAKEIYPSRVYDLLVGDGTGRKTDRSILDQVLGDVRSVRGNVNPGDQRKLDEYLESIRDIEKRIEHAANEQRLEGWRPSIDKPNMPRPDDKLPQDVPTHMKLMMDLIVLGFQMDKTRVATCLLNNDISAMTFDFLDNVKGALHVDLTHNGNDPEVEIMHMKTNAFHVQQLAYLVERMKGIDEGGSTLFDNSILMCCSNMFDGDAHQADHFPIIVAGRAGGSLETGRVLDYLEAGDDNRRACSLYLSLLDHAGVHLPRFGDTNQRLANI